MTEEIKRTLMMIADQSSSQGQIGISVTYLLKHLDIERQRLLEIIEMLEQAGYVQVQQSGRVKLVVPTLQGYEKAATWQKEKHEASWFGRIPMFLKVVGGSLLAALLGLLWWWLGLSPQTSDLQPVAASVPIKMYHLDIQPPIGPVPGSWFHFPNAPQRSQAIHVQSIDEYEELMRELLPEYVPVTFDGWVRFQFDVENVAARYQININSILIEVASGPVDDPEDVYFFPPELGGGEIRQYELVLSPQAAYSTRDGIHLYEAVLRSNDEAVDYIFLKPGERESLEVSINLGVPGNYTLTPVVRYAFREEISLLRADSYHVVYPYRYRTWIWDQVPMRCSGGSCTGGGEAIMTDNIIVDTQSGNVQMPGTSDQTGPGCLSSPKWIAFESSIVDYGYLNRLFLIDTNGNGLRMIGARALDRVKRHLEWTSDNKLLVSEPIWDERLSEHVQEMKVVDPSSGGAEAVVPDTLPAMKHWHDDAWIDVCFKDGKRCLGTRPFDDTNGDGKIDHHDATQIYLDQNGVLTRLGFSRNEYQGYLALSPDETSIAFVQGKSLFRSCENLRIYIMRIDGSELRQVTGTFGCYRNPVWSPDGQYLAFENTAHIYVIDLNTGDEIQLTNGPSSDRGPQWSADGQWVLAGGDRLSLTRWDGSCSQDVFIPPIGSISNVLMQP